MKEQEVILVTGALGVLGTELVGALRRGNGAALVIASDLRAVAPAGYPEGPYLVLNVMDKLALQDVVSRCKVKVIYHLAAVPLAVGEKNVQHTWNINVLGLLNVLDVAKIFGLRVFWPGSISVFGVASQKLLCPQHAVTEPVTVEGMTKLAGEHLCRYYFEHFGVDVRSIRFPGIVGPSVSTLGGVTDFVMEMLDEALRGKGYVCYLREETRVPVLYMPDAIRAVRSLMNAPAPALRIRLAYNISGITLSPKSLWAAIAEHLPGLNMVCKPDGRQVVADSWPQSMDHAFAAVDWGWQVGFDLQSMTEDMLKQLALRRGVLPDKQWGPGNDR